MQTSSINRLRCKSIDEHQTSVAVLIDALEDGPSIASTRRVRELLDAISLKECILLMKLYSKVHHNYAP